MGAISDEMGSFWIQFKVLAWKNLILKRRNWSILLLEFLVPLVVIVGLVVLKNDALPPKIIAENLPAESMHNNYFQDQYHNLYCGGQNLVWRCLLTCDDEYANTDFTLCQPQRIAVAPYDSNNAAAVSAAQQFVQWANASFPEAQQNSTFQYFSSADAFEDTIMSKTYSIDTNLPIYSVGLIFNAGAPNWEYTVRLNKTVEYEWGDMTNPKTSEPNLDISVSYNTQNPSEDEDDTGPYIRQYRDAGYFVLTDLVNSFIATETCRALPSSDANYCGPTEEYLVHTQGLVHFPSPEVATNLFWSSVGDTFCLLMIMSLLYPLSNVINSLVTEKESKLREGMMMMAMRGEALWASWIFHFFCLFLPLSIALTLASQTLFEHSDTIYIFWYFFSFFCASTAFCILVSNFFSKARTAAIVGCLLYFCGYFVYVGLPVGADRSTLLAACLHPAAAFTLGSLAFMEYEDAQIGITEYTWDVSQSNNITFADVIMMMFVDVIVLGALGWYIATIWPSEFGTHKPWYFPFMPSTYMTVDMAAPSYQEVAPGGIEMTGKGDAANDSHFEAVPESFNIQTENGSCVQILNLSKSFNTTNGVKQAVDNISLTMYSGQITALLGHNGAGKSTLVSMITGLISPDSGDAIIEGRSMKTQMAEIRKHLGVCPQHDVLFPDLTVEEHLIMFASFKGTPKDKLKDEVEKMIQSVGLTEKRHSYSKTLSGGQKRKLSVGLAFIGGSRVVFLDEPTSGMDPYSRRFTWNVIRQHREGRVVVLITHFMDEADLLGDRIAIMGDGKLVCAGSSLFLKNLYGVGYSLTLEKINANKFDTDHVTDVIHNAVPEALLLSDVGTELTFQLPFSACSKFQPLFEKLESDLVSLGLLSFGISVTTLEEVFIKVARGTNTISTATAGKEKQKRMQILDEQNTSSKAVVEEKDGEGDTERAPVVIASDAEPMPKSFDAKDNNYQMVSAVGEVEGLEVTSGRPRASSYAFTKNDQSNLLFSFCVQYYALLVKRLLYFKRDQKAWIYQYLVPVLFVLAGMLILTFTSNDVYEPLKALTPSMYNPDITDNNLPFPFSTGSKFCLNGTNTGVNDTEETWSWCKNVDYQSILMNNAENSASLPVIALNATDVYEMSYGLLYPPASTPDLAASTFGAVSFFEMGDFYDNARHFTYLIHGNYTAVHAGPLFHRLTMDALVRTISPGTTVSVNIYPLPTTYVASVYLSSFQTNLVVNFLTIAFAIIPASFAASLVREKEIKAKAQQMVSGAGIASYYIAAWCWDNAAYQITLWLVVILFVAFPRTEDLSSNENVGFFILLLLLFGFAVTGFTYLTSFIFTNSSAAQIGTIMIHFVSGFFLSIAGIVLRLVPSTRDIYNDYLRFIFDVFPLCALADGLNSMSVIDFYSSVELGGTRSYTAGDWEITGIPVTMLAIEAVVYLLLAIFWEYGSELPGFLAVKNFMYNNEVPEDSNENKDTDVIEEETLVLNDNTALTPVVAIKNVKKVYDDGKYAVKGVSLGIPNGECFGLLGINGAGKTTLLSILCGEVSPSGGSVSLGGLSVADRVHECRRNVGFCPQFDALFELLTAREHLYLYGRLKGIKDEHLDRVVNDKIAEMSLTEYADRLAGTYSGGNKRKLSVAIAMIGEPTIVFLDEPSTGMDPNARRFMWEVINDIVTKREKCSLILTTHSMEEAEALCTRIGIMVGGVMRCLGSPQHLRTSYGDGFQVEIDMIVPTLDEVAHQCRVLAEMIHAMPADTAQRGSLGSIASNSSLPAIEAADGVTRAQLEYLFNNQPSEWLKRLTRDGTASDLLVSLEHTGTVAMKHLASWWLLELRYDNLTGFLNDTFGSYILHERQISKMRVELTGLDNKSDPPVERKLSGMFGAIEAKREQLCIQGYSISQTSLEQIFNHFAAQQEEESHLISGLVSTTNK